jgi:F-type H+-transporting ATPase subunit delta
MRGIRISSRYAKSLLSLCVEKGQVDIVFTDMKMIHQTIVDSRDLELMLLSPIIKPDTKTRILDKVFGASISPITKTFLTLLTNKGRENMVMEIASSFVEQVQRHQDITSVDVVSATALDEATRAKVLALASQLAHGKVQLTERINPELIGGFVLRVGDQQVDTSIFNSIRNLKREFAENPYVAEL